MLRACSVGFCGAVNGDALPRHAQMLSKLVGGNNLNWDKNESMAIVTRRIRILLQRRNVGYQGFRTTLENAHAWTNLLFA